MGLFYPDDHQFSIFPSAVSGKKVYVSSDSISQKKEKYTQLSGKVDVIPMLSVSPCKLVAYNSFINLSRTVSHDVNFLKNEEEGVMSCHAANSVNKAIDWLAHLSKFQFIKDAKIDKNIKFKINFITLTLPAPQVSSYQLPCGKILKLDSFKSVFPAANLGFGKFIYHSFIDSDGKKIVVDDKYIKANLLNQFLTEIRQKYKNVCYVWKAETQANGNIHFHITTNKYIFLGDIRNLWNRILNKTDFISRYHERFKNMLLADYIELFKKNTNWSLNKIKKSYGFGVKSNWNNPNTTDVHSVRNIKNIAGYLSKYFVKNDVSRRHVEGRLWRLSYALSRFKSCKIVVDYCISREFEYLAKCFPKKFKIKDFCNLLFCKIEEVGCYLQNSRIIKEFVNYKAEIMGTFNLNFG